MPTTSQISSVLVANRGEIARRVLRTCRDRGLATVAVFSDADADSPHVREADRAVRLPGVTPAQTYLRADLVIEAARRAGADAIHPGYGFMSESADFAQAVIDAGLTWIGPPVQAVALMGSKVESKALMARVGVPVLAPLDPAVLTEADLPVLIKASAGGGGRGMRVVRALTDLPGELAAAAREAASAFGDPTVFCERYVESGRHIEVQVLADAHGTVWALGERECSLQRRHQKVIEEAPSPLVERIGPELRARLLDAASRAASSVGYVGAGTVEFLADDDGSFFFLEMNTRLQVEHPVTENVTGVDLVGLQLDVAAGTPLTGPQPVMRGHSIEARLYAEDPSRDWQPQSGTLHVFEVPGVDGEFEVVAPRGIRLDSGVVGGSVVGIHYDSMLAKVIATAPTRTEAIRLLAHTLQRSEIHGVQTNRDLLVGALRDPDFGSGDFSTAFFDTHPPVALADGAAGDLTVAAVVAGLADAAQAREQATGVGGVVGGWRNLPAHPQRRSYAGAHDQVDVDYAWGRDGLTVESPMVAGLLVVDVAADQVVLDLAGVRERFTVRRHGEGLHVAGPSGPVTLRRVPRFADPADAITPGALVAPMPGSVVRVAVAVGDDVARGMPLLWLEAMKMEHVVTAATAGRVVRVVEVGTQVEPGTVLAVVEDAMADTPESEHS
ncbi:MAG: biotin carboxylase N-terminal domain-containing protein [Ornithinibacter sp.]